MNIYSRVDHIRDGRTMAMREFRRDMARLYAIPHWPVCWADLREQMRELRERWEDMQRVSENLDDLRHNEIFLLVLRQVALAEAKAERLRTRRTRLRMLWWYVKLIRFQNGLVTMSEMRKMLESVRQYEESRLG